MLKDANRTVAAHRDEARRALSAAQRRAWQSVEVCKTKHDSAGWRNVEPWLLGKRRFPAGSESRPYPG
jgi:hypothetical protein